jgi:hypothetical protein
MATTPIHTVLAIPLYRVTESNKSKSESTVYGLDQSGVAPLRAARTVMKWRGKRMKQVIIPEFGIDQ